MQGLKDETIIVTGGGGGIGSATCRRLAREGAKVAVFDRNLEAAQKVVAEITAAGGQAAAFDCDITDRASVDAAVAATQAQLGPVAVLVNNAGWDVFLPFTKTVPAQWEQLIAINLTGSFRMATAVLPQLKESKGNVINTASMSSYSSLPGVPGYGASKAGVVQMTMTLAESWARFGVRVNAFAPGWVSTNMTRGAENNEAYSNRLIEHTPMRRWGKPSEMAGTALFLASDAASFITGVTIPVDGGFKAVM